MRKRIEEGFGWMKTIGGLRKTRYRGRARVQWHAYLVAAAYNLLRIALGARPRMKPPGSWPSRSVPRSKSPTQSH